MLQIPMQPLLFCKQPHHVLWAGAALPIQGTFINPKRNCEQQTRWFMTMQHLLIAGLFSDLNVVDEIILAPSVALAERIAAQHEYERYHGELKHSTEKYLFNCKRKLYPIVATAARLHNWRRVTPGEGWQLAPFSAHAIKFHVRGEEGMWLTCEHAFHASKFEDEEIIQKIWEARTPWEAKQIARLNTSKMAPDWDEERRLAVMEAICQAKLDQHADVQEALLATGQRPLIREDRQGGNSFGQIWMDLRRKLVRRQCQEMGGLYAAR